MDPRLDNSNVLLVSVCLPSCAQNETKNVGHCFDETRRSQNMLHHSVTYERGHCCFVTDT